MNTNFKPGDVANGQILTKDGQWVPLAPPNVTPPKKKRRTGLWVGLGVSGVLVVGMVSCTAAALNGVDDALKTLPSPSASVDQPSSSGSETDNNLPTPVKEGAAFEHDGYTVAKGWKIKAQEFGGLTITGMHVTNVSHEPHFGGTDPDTAMFKVILWKGSTNAAEIHCTGKAIAQGQDSSMDCFSADDVNGKVPAHDKVTVEDTF